MKRYYSLMFAVIGTLALAILNPVAGEERGGSDDRDRELVRSFLEHVNSLDGLSAQQKQLAKEAVEGQPSAAITEALIALYPDFAKGVDSAEQDRLDQGIELLAPLAESNDLYLAADASFYLARMLMNSERFEQAIPLLDRLVDDLHAHSIHSGDSMYFLGVAQAGMLNRREAIESFSQFLEQYTDAAERLRVSAWRQIQELQAIEDGQLGDVQRYMDYSRRRLDQQETGDATQEKQDRIVQMLAKLIKEEEKKECNSSCKNSGKNKPKEQENAQAPKQSDDPKEGKSSEGGSSSNANGEATQKTYDESPASPWSRLRDRSRDPANNAIKEKLPARYRDIVEKYYEAANGNPGETKSKNKK